MHGQPSEAETRIAAEVAAGQEAVLNLARAIVGPPTRSGAVIVALHELPLLTRSAGQYRLQFGAVSLWLDEEQLRAFAAQVRSLMTGDAA